jgi:hypothetical protein
LGTEMHIGDGEVGRRRGRARRRQETALRACRGGEARRGGAARRVGEEQRGTSEKRGASGTGTARRGGGEDGCVEEEQRDLEPPPFVTLRITNRGKRPFSFGSYYEPRLKTPLLSRVASRTVTKGAFRVRFLKANFRPFCHGWCYHP